MSDRSIIDYFGRRTGATLQEYVWKSKPTRSPYTDRAVRCVVVEDEMGRYWGGARIGPGDGEKGRNELWIHPFRTKEAAMKLAREFARSFLTAEAEQQANDMPNAAQGKELVRVTMDDGWSVAINAPAPKVADKARLEAFFERLAKSSKMPSPEQKKGRSRDWPSR